MALVYLIIFRGIGNAKSKSVPMVINNNLSPIDIKDSCAPAQPRRIQVKAKSLAATFVDTRGQMRHRMKARRLAAEAKRLKDKQEQQQFMAVLGLRPEDYGPGELN